MPRRSSPARRSGPDLGLVPQRASEPPLPPESSLAELTPQAGQAPIDTTSDVDFSKQVPIFSVPAQPAAAVEPASPSPQHAPRVSHPADAPRSADRHDLAPALATPPMPALPSEPPATVPLLASRSVSAQTAPARPIPDRDDALSTSRLVGPPLSVASSSRHSLPSSLPPWSPPPPGALGRQPSAAPSPAAEEPEARIQPPPTGLEGRTSPHQQGVAVAPAAAPRSPLMTPDRLSRASDRPPPAAVDTSVDTSVMPAVIPAVVPAVAPAVAPAVVPAVAPAGAPAGAPPGVISGSASAQPRTEGTELAGPAPPQVHIRIGRIEIRNASPPASPRPPATRQPDHSAPTLSLNDYLRRPLGGPQRGE
jgi:hypothetical protein